MQHCAELQETPYGLLLLHCLWVIGGVHGDGGLVESDVVVRTQNGSTEAKSYYGSLRQSICWNKHRVDQSPCSRAESLLAWGVSLGQFRFFGVPVPAANLSPRLQWRLAAIFFFLHPFYGTHGLRKTPKLQVVLLAQVPSISTSQALFSRESDGRSYFLLHLQR